MCTGKNDSIVALTDSLRREHDRIARVDTRLGIVQQIVDCEQKSYQLMRERERLLEQSRVKESAFWDKEGKKAAISYNTSLQEKENRQSENRKTAEKIKEPAPVPEIIKDSVLTSDTKRIPAAINVTPKTATAENLVFKVQVGAFKNGMITPIFKKAYAKVSKLRKIDKYTDPRKYVVYTVGGFTHYTDASKMKDQLIHEGMKGSFVVAYLNGAKIPVTQALKMAGEK